MRQPVASDPLLRREIGRVGIAAIAMNGVIGSGIFALPAVAIAQAGYSSPWLFLLCGLLILSVALTFARLASFFAITGGPIVYTTHAFGRFVGFQTGLLIYISRVAAIAASANLIVDHAAAVWTPLDSGAFRLGAIVAYVTAATFLNAVGVRAGMAAVLLISILKLAPLLLLIAVGLPAVEWKAVAAAGLPRHDLGESMLVMMYAFIGFEFSLINAGETRDARASIPKTLVRTVIAIALCYTLIQLVAVSVAPDLGASETPLMEVARRLIGPWGALLLGLGVVFSIGGASLASLLTAPRLTYALARDGSLPAWFGTIDERTGVPVNSVVFCGLASAVLAVSQHFVWLLIFSTFVRLGTYALCILSLPAIERSIAVKQDQFRLAGGLTIPAIALLMTLWLLAQSTLDNVVITIALIAAGAVIFYSSPRQKDRGGDQQ